MKNSIKALAVLAILGFAGSVLAQSNPNTVSTSVPARATIVLPITLSTGPYGTAMSFGTWIGTGNVTLSPASGDNAVGGTGMTKYGGANYTGSIAATWTVGGEPGYSFDVNNTTAGTFPTLTGGTGTAPTITALTTNCAESETANLEWGDQLDATTGHFTLYMGGTLNNSSATSYGNWAGTVNLSVSYE